MKLNDVTFTVPTEVVTKEPTVFRPKRPNGTLKDYQMGVSLLINGKNERIFVPLYTDKYNKAMERAQNRWDLIQIMSQRSMKICSREQPKPKPKKK